jgi:hypothetical protein
MIKKSRTEAGPFSIVQVGFTDQDVSFKLVPLALMKDNTYGLGLATPVSCARPTYRTKARSNRLQAALGLERVGRCRDATGSGSGSQSRDESPT